MLLRLHLVKTYRFFYALFLSIVGWKVVGAIGFEPTTYGTQNRRATKLRHAPNPFVLRMKHKFDKSDILVGVILVWFFTVLFL